MSDLKLKDTASSPPEEQLADQPEARPPDPPPEPDETEIKCTLCGLRACWSSS
jgi:hypothetical protein